jgi:hypothetical protein
LLMQPFTNVIASEIVVCATIYKCVVFFAALNGLTPPAGAAPTIPDDSYSHSEWE